MAQALAEANRAIGVSDPNPRVGCVIGNLDGTVFGVGATQQAGGPHAEVMALAAVRSAGIDPRGACAWVTLEPCSHHGRTPPCCDALISAGLSRVVVAVEDPFPAVRGSGIARLRAAGIDVEFAAADMAAASRDLNIGFFSRFERGRPWVRVKTASSIDGRTALPDGRSQWITGAAARSDVQSWRKRAGAILTGIGTVLADDPRLDVRENPGPLQPLRVIVDSRLRTPPTARILATPGRCLIASVAGAERARSADPLDAELLGLPSHGGRVDLVALMSELGRRQINEVHVEAGPGLVGSLADAGLIDELIAYIAPMLIGAGRNIADFGPLNALSDSLRFNVVAQRLIQTDLFLRLIRRAPDERPAAPPESRCREL